MVLNYLNQYSDLLVFVVLSLIIGYTDEENKVTSGVTVSIHSYYTSIPRQNTPIYYPFFSHTKMQNSVSYYSHFQILYHPPSYLLFELPHDKTKMAYAPSEDSDQPGHPPSLIRVLAVRIKKLGPLATN